jgi:hypothetical protein
MSEKVLCIIRRVGELLFFTPDRVVVANCMEIHKKSRVEDLFYMLSGSYVRSTDTYNHNKKKEKEYLELPLESVLTADEKNFAIPNSEITKVELRKRWVGVELNILAREKEHKSLVTGLIPEKKKTKIEDYEKLLRPVFGDKLSVEK